MGRTAIAVATTALLALVAWGCGTTENAGGATTPADAQAAVPQAPADQAAPPAAAAATAPGDGNPFPLLPKKDPGADAPSGGPCATDADCVPAACCHPKTCVAKAQKGSCVGVMCTMDCRGGTMDCGGGKCLCKDGVCAAELTTPAFMQNLDKQKPQ